MSDSRLPFETMKIGDCFKSSFNIYYMVIDKGSYVVVFVDVHSGIISWDIKENFNCLGRSYIPYSKIPTTRSK